MLHRGGAYILITIVLAAIAVLALKWILLPVIGPERAEAAASFTMWLIMWSFERIIYWGIVLLILAGGLALVIKPILDIRRHRKIRVFMFLGGLLVLYVAWIGLGEAWTTLFNTDVGPGA